MRVLIVGNGGREHALAWRVAQSPRLTQLFVTRPNAGCKSLAEAVDVAVDDIEGLVAFAKQAAIDLTIVGPELPLTLGITDRFTAEGLRCFGPSMAAACLEGSKAFAKEIMVAAGVPTAQYATFDEVEPAVAWVRQLGRGVAVKADGLAAGKGVVLCDTVEEAEAALKQMLGQRAFGSAGATVVVEELLSGEEVSFIALCDGKTVKPLATSQDHKRIFEGDRGPNTGGMGAYSPAPVVDDAMSKHVMETVMQPVVDEMAGRGTPFVGFLYAGLMLTADGPSVLEFNVRLGDPETQPLMMRLDSDLLDLMSACLDGTLHEADIQWDKRSAICVVLAAEGYPQAAVKGAKIDGLDAAAALADVVVFHAGTQGTGADAVVSGGRVLGVTARGLTLKDAAARAYSAVDLIQWPGRQVRRDIGWRALTSN